MFVSRLTAGRSIDHPSPAGRGVYLYVIDGDVGVNGVRMETGAAAQIVGDPEIEIVVSADSELILVDVSLD